VLGAVLRRGLVLAGLGVAVGLALAAATARALGGLLFGVAPVDAPTYVGIAALLATASLVACAMPALRAARLDPMSVLRES
jgi:ABC-type antimicrobial peptide transport system permease subunit